MHLLFYSSELWKEKVEELKDLLRIIEAESQFDGSNLPGKPKKYQQTYQELKELLVNSRLTKYSDSFSIVWLIYKSIPVVRYFRRSGKSDHFDDFSQRYILFRYIIEHQE